MTDQHIKFDQRVDRLLAGIIDRKEFLELEAQMLADPTLRRRFRMRARLESNLRTECQTVQTDIFPPLMNEPSRPVFSRWFLAIGIAVALALFACFVFFQRQEGTPQVMATLESQEGATWSAGNAPANGSGLTAGTLKLERGVASLRFESGAIAALEAPVTIELINPMRCRLSRGKAVFDVPDSAVGFVVETPNGYAVDHGTRFAVGLQPDGEHVEFGVLSGRISVHHKKTKVSEDVRTGGMVMLTPSGIGDSEQMADTSSIRPVDSTMLTFRTNQHETSIVRGDLRERFLNPELLMVKKDLSFAGHEKLDRLYWPKDRRALIAFDVGGRLGQQVEHVKLRLNIVPSGRGYAWLLPERTRIQVYGVRDSPELERWTETNLKWAEAPGSVDESTKLDLSEVSLLGSFQIERSQIEGPVAFESTELTRFVKKDETGVVGFLLVADSLPLDRWSLVHAFASSRHHSAAGPLLEIKVRQDPPGP